MDLAASKAYRCSRVCICLYILGPLKNPCCFVFLMRGIGSVSDRSGRLGFELRVGFGFEIFNSHCVAVLTGPDHQVCVSSIDASRQVRCQPFGRSARPAG